MTAGENGSFDLEARISIKGIERRVPLRGRLERGDSELRQLHLYGRFDRHDFGIGPRRPSTGSSVGKCKDGASTVR